MTKDWDDDSWKQTENHFHHLIDLPVGEREEYLAGLNTTEPEIASRVRELLEAHTKSGMFLETGAMDEISEMAGKVIGPWKIVRELGRGGMSTVYLAERTDGSFERKVAVKFLYGFMPGPQLHARLIAEQRILAKLDHQNISGLIDAGMTVDGRPYFILEYVDGYPITEYCDRNKLGLMDRIILFEQVCEAVHYAHQRLIIHRDLKPSNIMVSRDGEVKLLDFGIAKLLEKDTGEPQFVTQTGLSVMTPEYASPEQIQNSNITTSSDCYTLGLLLCELLTGYLPYEVKRKSPFEIGKIITDTVPGKPSTLLTGITADFNRNKSSSGRGNEQNEIGAGNPIENPESHISEKIKWSSKLRGDLDNIILKAIRKEPERRYGSVRELMQDLRNYRMNLPVSAGRDTLAYTAGKFIRRHRTAVVVASLAGLLLVLSTIFSFWQAQLAREQKVIAEQRFDDVRQLANNVLFEFHDAVVDLPGSTAARVLLVERALDYLDKLSMQHHYDSDLNVELASAYQKVGNVQGNPTNANLGRPNDALNSYDKGVELVQLVLDREPDHKEARVMHSILTARMADVHAVLGDRELSEQFARQSTERFRELADMYPDDARIVTEYAISLIKYGDLLGNPHMYNFGQRELALKQYQTAETALASLLNNSWTIDHESEDQVEVNSTLVRLLGVVYERTGNIFDYENDLERALEFFRKSMEYRKYLVELNPLMTDAIRDEAVAHEKLGHIYRKKGQVDEARTQYHKSFEIFNWLADADSYNIQAQQSLAISHIHLGNISFHPQLPSLNDREAAKTHFTRSQQLLDALIATNPGNTEIRRLLEITGNRMRTLEIES